MPARVPLQPEKRVTRLELFFDLVFVLTITQLTEVVHSDPGIVGLGVAVLVLANIWWMYAGYAWLTNNVSLATLPRRLLLLVSMAAFLVMAIATPNAFGSSGLAFGLAYLVVVLVHFVMFRMSFAAESTRAILGTAPYNFGAAVLLVVAGFVEGPLDWWLWGGAVLIHIAMLEFRRSMGYALRAEHFVERHGIVLIVALGESVVALGLGIGHRPLDWPLVAAAVLGLCLAAALWWMFFSDNDELAVRALDRAGPERIARVAALGFGYGFTAMLLGVILASAGLKDVFVHPYGHLEPAVALLLAGGCASYVLGIAIFRHAMGGTRARALAIFAVGVAATAATALIGEFVSGLVQIAVLVLLLLAITYLTRLPASLSAPGDVSQGAGRREPAEGTGPV